LGGRFLPFSHVSKRGVTEGQAAADSRRGRQLTAGSAKEGHGPVGMFFHLK